MEKTLRLLNELEREGVLGRYAIGGAVGATFYAEPVVTFDLDIFVMLPQTTGGLVTVSPLYESLRRRGCMPEDDCVLIEGVPVQFLPAYNALLEEALAEARDTLYGQTTTRVLRAEHLVAIALQTGRRQGQAARAALAGAGAGGSSLSRRRAGPPWSRGDLEGMVQLTPEIERLIKAKEARRLRLAALSFPEKVSIVVELQRMVAPILLARGRPARVWQMDETDAPRQ